MRVLVVGGSAFIGAGIVSELLGRGHAVAVANRGVTKDPHGGRVERLVADRKEKGALARAIGGREFEAAIDVSAFAGSDSEEAVAALRGRTGHLVHVSTGQVYLVLKSCGKPAREDEYAGETIPAPEAEEDETDWRYGLAKRACEDVLARAASESGFRSTRVRIGIVHGPLDYQHRLTAYLARFRDGGPVLLQDGGTRLARHVDVRDVAAAVAAIAEKGPEVSGEALNLAWSETPTARDVVLELARISGSKAPLVPVPRRSLHEAGLLPHASPLGGPWASVVDPARARAAIAFAPRPWKETVAWVAEAFFRGETAPPPGLDRRADEIALARRS